MKSCSMCQWVEVVFILINFPGDFCQQMDSPNKASHTSLKNLFVSQQLVKRGLVHLEVKMLMKDFMLKKSQNNLNM